MLSISKPLRAGEEAITSRECQCCWRAEGDSELRATLTLQREWRKMAARVGEWVG